MKIVWSALSTTITIKIVKNTYRSNGINKETGGKREKEVNGKRGNDNDDLGKKALQVQNGTDDDISYYFFLTFARIEYYRLHEEVYYKIMNNY